MSRLLATLIVTVPSLVSAAAAPSEDPAGGSVVWPEQWVVFEPLDRDDPVLPQDQLQTIPETIQVAGQVLEPQHVEPDEQGVVDLGPLFGEVASGNTAYVFIPLTAEEPVTTTIGMGADWWMQAWLDGEPILDTTDDGNREWPPSTTDHTVEVSLEPGEHLLAVRFVSGSGSSKLAVGGPAEMGAVPQDEYPILDEPVRGMASLMERHGEKPYDLFRDEDGLKTHRVIFEDRDFGTEVWMLDHSPTADHVWTASVWSAWNSNASRLWVRGRRPLTEDDTRLGWLFNEDFSRLEPHGGDYSIPAGWSDEDPQVYYFHRRYGSDPSVLYRGRVDTGEVEPIAEWDTFPRERVYGFTRDREHLFLDTPNGGLWVPYEPGDEPIPDSNLHAGRPGGPPWPDGEPTRHGELFELSNVSRNPTVDTEQWGPLIRIRVGVKIHRETGEKQAVIAPLAGSRAYLETYTSGRVEFPEGEEWEDVKVLMDDDIEQMLETYRDFPVMTHGHESPSPDRRYFARDGPTDLIEEFPYNRLGDYDFRSYHMHWVRHPRFFASWTRGWRFQSFTRGEHANVIHQAFSDLTSQPIVNSKHRFNGYYRGADFTMLSPDATKVHYGSSMTGRFKNYIAVMARPRPPVSVAWQEADGAVELTWAPSAYSAETRGYLVYRSRRSGDGYALMTEQPVEGTSWTDDTVEPGTPYYYVVTSLEQAGLESGYSREAARAGVDVAADLDDPLVIYREAEPAIRDLDTSARPGLAMGVDRREASDWYYLYRHPEHDTGRATLPLEIPADGEYTLWARLRSGDGDPVRWQLDVAETTLEATTDRRQWTWVRAGRTALPEGQQTLALSTEDGSAQIDVLALATDAAFAPDGPRPETTQPPPPPENLEAENVRDRVNQLTWRAPQAPALSHYNVYASREPLDEPAQEHLIGSPTYEELIDWGLRADTRYHYAVTAVDRRRQESEPVHTSARTPAAERPEHTLELAFADANLEGDFERSSSGALRGEAFLVPEEPDRNTASWTIDVPETADYFLWLCHLQRGDGSRGSTVNQEVRVRLNGQTLTRLGGGPTDLHAPDDLIEPDHPLADRLWTWAWPGEMNLEGVTLPAGEHTLTLENLHGEIRYDVLLLTNEPAFQPQDGRLRQR